MRSRYPLAAAALAGSLTLVVPLAVHTEPPVHHATSSIQSLASLRTTPPIGAGLDAGLQRGCVPIQRPERAPAPRTSGWKRTAAHGHGKGLCDRPARWRV